MKELKVNINGMTCASCAATIERELAKETGIKECQINFATESGKIVVEDSVDTESVISKIIEIGYGASLPSDENRKNENQEIDKGFSKFLIAFLFSIVIFLYEMGPLKSSVSREINWYIQLTFALPIWIWIGSPFNKSLLTFLTKGHSNMNTLIGVGTGAAFIYSFFVTVFNSISVNMGLTQKVYFEAVGFIISFVYLGKYFEYKSKQKTKESLNALFELSAKNAIRLDGQKQTEVPVDQIRVGDLLRILPGSKIPVDGKVIKGSSFVDESMITGEPVAVKKETGDIVYAGTINDSSSLDYKATKVGSDTFLAQVIQFVENAQLSKPRIQALADKVGGFFTPLVLFLSVVTFLSWMIWGPEPKWGNAISTFISVLVIACPCALGLATPTAVVVATGRASSKGLLIAGGDVIEKGHSIDAIVFDKTGTITEGRPKVTDVKYLDKTDLKDIFSIQQFSDHPLAKAMLSMNKEFSYELGEPDSFLTVKGKGIQAEIEDKEFFIGKRDFLEENTVTLDPSLESEKIGSVVYIAKEGRHVATFVVSDEIKEEAKFVIQELKKLNVESWMVTGDNEQTASVISKEVGIEHYASNVLPVDKSKYIKDLQAKGLRVAMVGDGINDAPALAVADLSIAMGTGTDVAIESSDVTIVKGDLTKVIAFLKLSAGSMKIIKQNLFLSFVYNTLLIPIAAGALVVFGGPMMPPVLASIAMGLSSISVVTNSLRIKTLI